MYIYKMERNEKFNDKSMKKKQNNYAWHELRIVHAIDWWRSPAFGIGNFNEGLYIKFLKIRKKLEQ